MIRMKKKIFFLLLCIGAIQTMIAQQQSLTLQQAIETAIRNNYQVRQSELDMEAAKINWYQARANLLPSINAFVSHGINKGRSIDPFTNSYVDQELTFAQYGMSGDLILFNGLSLQNAIKQTRLAYEAGKMDLQQAKDNTAMQVVLAYLQVLANEDLLNIARSQAELTRSQVERLEVLDKEGAIVPATLYDLKGQLSNDELSMVNSNNALNSAKLTLCQLMFIPYNKDLQLDRSGLEGTPAPYGVTAEELYQLALKHLALVKAADYRVKSAEKAVKVAKGNAFPVIGLSGSLGSNYSSVAEKSIPGAINEVPSGDYVQIAGNKFDVITQQQDFSAEKITYFDQLTNNYNTQVSLGLRIPIFNSLQNHNRIKLAKINQKSVEVDQANTLLVLQQQVEQAAFNASAAYDRYKASADQVNAFSESFRSAEVRFNAGAITSVDYLVAKNNSDRANINLTQSKYEYIFRTRVLDYYSGKPLW
jgi:outer membrane protein